MRLSHLTLFVSFLFLSCQGQQSKTVSTIDVRAFSDKLHTSENPQLIDVRTPEEFAADRIETAKNINWNGADFAPQAEKLDKSKPVFVYCKVGGRSSQAANKLAEMGFAEVYNLDGGILKWNAAGMGNKSDKPIGISSQEFQQRIHAEKKVIVNFYAKWCEPCKKMEPYLLKMQLQGAVKMIRLNADENKTILETMKLDGLPVLLIYENGKETWRNIGYVSEDELRKHL